MDYESVCWLQVGHVTATFQRQFNITVETGQKEITVRISEWVTELRSSQVVLWHNI